MFHQLRLRTHFGLAALMLVTAFTATTRLCRAAEEPQPPAIMPPAIEYSLDKSLTVSVSNGVMTVGKATFEKVTVKTPEGDVTKLVSVVKKSYDRGGEKEKYLAAKFVPVKADKPTLIAVSGKLVYAVVGESGDLIWTVKHGVEADKATIVFKDDEVKITLGDKVMRFETRTGKELKD